MNPTTKKMRPAEYKRATHFILTAVILGLTGLVYSNSLHGVFFLDDTYHLTDYPVSISDSLTALKSHPFVTSREIVNITFAFNRAIHGADVFGYHLVNIGVHALNALLVYFLIFLVLSKMPSGLKESASPDCRIIAFFGAVVFAVHPLLSACVNYTIQRYTLMMVFFYLSGVLWYLTGRNQTQTKKWACYALSVFCAWLAFHCKEIAVTFPLTILCFEYFLRSENEAIGKKQVFGLLFFLGVFSGVAAAELYLIGWFESPGARLWSPWQQFQAESVAFLHYWKMLLLPLDRWMNIDHDFFVSGHTVDGMAMLAILGHGAIFISAWLLFKNGRKISALGVCWFYISLLPYWIVPEADLLVNYKAYFPAVGFVMIAADLILRVGQNKKVLSFAITAFAFCMTTVLMMQTFDRNRVYQNNLLLWEDTARKSPSKARVLNNRGFVYYSMGMLEKALSDFTRAIDFSPGYARAYENRGCLYFDRNEFNNALEDFKKSLSLNTETARTLTNLGSTYVELDRLDEARECFEKALTIDPDYSEAYYNQGLMHMKDRQWFDAIIDFSEALSLNPDNGPAYEKRGQLVFSFNKEAACADFKAACDRGTCFQYKMTKDRGICP